MHVKRIIPVQLLFLALSVLADTDTTTVVRLQPARNEETTETTTQLQSFTRRRRDRRLEEAGEAVVVVVDEGGEGGEEVNVDAEPGDGEGGNAPPATEETVTEEGGKGADPTTPGDAAGGAVEQPVADASETLETPAASACSSTSDCLQCYTASQSLLGESDEAKACAWKIDLDDTLRCVEVPSEDAMQKDMCSDKDEAVEDATGEGPENNEISEEPEESTTEETTQPAADDGGDDGGGGGGGGGFFMGVVLLALIGGAVYFVRTKLLPGGGIGKMKEVMDGSDLQSVFTTSGSSAVRSAGKYENVPLTSSDDDDDEEWGWEDGGESNGDIELPKKEEKKPDFSLGLANSSNNRSGTSSSRLTPPMSKSSPVTSRPTRTIPATKTPDWSEPTRPAASPKPVPALPSHQSPTLSATSPPSSGSMPVMPLKITSLGSKTSRPGGVTKKKKAKPASKPEDDLFASMGLAAKPSFSASKPATKATASVPSWKAADTSEPASADWDDADLDDLLDD